MLGRDEAREAWRSAHLFSTTKVTKVARFRRQELHHTCLLDASRGLEIVASINNP